MIDIYPFEKYTNDLNNYPHDYFETIKINESKHDSFFYISYNQNILDFQEYDTNSYNKIDSTELKQFIDDVNIIEDFKRIQFLSSVKNFIFVGYKFESVFKFLPWVFNYDKNIWIRSEYSIHLFNNVSFKDNIILYSLSSLTDEGLILTTSHFTEKELNNIYKVY